MSQLVITDDSHLLCVSQYANSQGICSAGDTSKNKGQACDTNDDCPNSDNTATAKCQCSWNTNKTKYCDLLPGDDEWVTVRTNF